jgi:hypothetical protein
MRGAAAGEGSEGEEGGEHCVICIWEVKCVWLGENVKRVDELECCSSVNSIVKVLKSRTLLFQGQTSLYISIFHTLALPGKLAYQYCESGRSYAKQTTPKRPIVQSSRTKSKRCLSRPSHFVHARSVARAIADALHADPGETCSVSKFPGLAVSAPLVWARGLRDIIRKCCRMRLKYTTASTFMCPWLYSRALCEQSCCG